MRHILVRREAAGLEDGRSGEAVDIRVGPSHVISQSVEPVGLEDDCNVGYANASILGEFKEGGGLASKERDGRVGADGNKVFRRSRHNLSLLVC